MHFLSNKNTVSLKPQRPSFKKLIISCQVGVAAFVGEVSSAVIAMVFNLLILSIEGNIGIAAYGIAANSALVAAAFFNGISQGAQPLISEGRGSGRRDDVKKAAEMGIFTSLIFAFIIISFVWIFTDDIVALFNKEANERLAELAKTGIRIYFAGFLFSGINVFCANAMSAAALARWAFVLSVLRGFVFINISAFVLVRIFGMNGIWSAYPVSEILLFTVTAVAMKKDFLKSI